jgi:excisionase family DNA binding protein
MAFKGAVRPDDAMDVKNERSDFVEDLSDLVLLRIEIVSELLGLSRSRIYELIAVGDLPSITIGRSRRVAARQLREWLDRRCQ